MQAAAFPISDYNYLEVQNTFRAVRECWPNADVRAALFNAGFAAGSHSCRSQKKKSTISWKRMSKPHLPSRGGDHYVPGPVARRARHVRHAALHRRDGCIARECDYVCIFGGQIRAALALSESERGGWKGKYTRMCLQLQYARYMFADQPCFLGGARMSPPSSLLRLSDDPSLRTLQVVIDGGTYMIQTAHIAWELN